MCTVSMLRAASERRSVRIRAESQIRREARGRTGEQGIARFLKTGRQPPKGVKLLGRWTHADFSGGYDLLEADDAKDLAQFALTWSDLMTLTIVPVMEDQALSEVLQRAGK